jgi:multidrug efflux system membrane fusion protein
MMVIEQKKQGFPFKWLMIAAFIAAGVYYGPGLVGDSNGQPQQPPAAPVSVATVVVKPVTQWTEFSGIFQAVNAAEIRPQVSGQITAIHFTDGAQVKKGEALFTIDPRPFEAALTTAKAALNQSKAAYDRAQKLVKSKAISPAELEQAQSAYEQALGVFQTAQVNLGYTAITAPISGKVSRAEITVGNVVEKGSSAPLMASIVSLSPIYASFEIDEQTYLKAIQGVPASKLKMIPVEVGLSNAQGTPLAAKVHSFDNQITPGSGTIRVRAILDNADNTLLPGLYARVRIGSPDPEEVALVHPSAIGTDQSKKFVMVVNPEGKAEYREVTLGDVVDGLQVVTSGLKADEQVIVSGLQRVRPGDLVQGEPVDMTTLKPLAAPTDAAPDASETP